ncbi:MAG TPA: hypothetical protein PKE69_21965 [Pyrinomonadaceae bacterium]|nr:hypothetical protein [Pyrinomonadaceae bacterium]
MRSRYQIGGEHKTAFIFSVIYLFLGIIFEEIYISILIFSLFAISIILERFGIEFPLAIYVRAVHLLFLGLIIMAKLNVI